jgi:hypothetical protein
MQLADYLKRVLGLAETVHRWQEALLPLDPARRERVARYAEAIADTLQRAADALAEASTRPGDTAAARRAVRELGRIAGYVETIVGVLEHHLDGRKLAGVKRRLVELAAEPPTAEAARAANAIQLDRLSAAEGYFRALADALRA